jgi:8-oxo-dGTP pyrophosphatase MutT (NUDIX family)
LLFATTAIADDKNPDKIDAAGCLIVTPHGFVVGINRLLNRLQLPAGKHRVGESARQTAVRETYEETGLNVVAGSLAMTFDDAKVRFYHCTIANADIDFAYLQPVDKVEVSRALVINPITMTTFNGEKITTPWRFEGMHTLLKSAYINVVKAFSTQ